MEINGTKGSLATVCLGQLPNTLIFRGENITPQGDSWGEEVENILGIIIACNPQKLNTTWQNKQLCSISLVLKFHGGRVKWDKTVSLKLLGEAILALIENVCVRKLAQKMIIKMKNKLRSTALILILTMTCILLSPKCAISSPRNLWSWQHRERKALISRKQCRP